MQKAIANGITFDIRTKDEDFLVNDQRFTWDLAEIDKNYFHIIHDGKSFRAEIIKIDPAEKKVVIKVNNHLHEVIVKDAMDLLLEKLGMSNSTGGKVNNVKAPMPGLIIDLRIREGEEVKQNDPLIVLEAMKMENLIKSPGDGIVKSIKVKKGDSVEKNQVLIEF